MAEINQHLQISLLIDESTSVSFRLNQLVQQLPRLRIQHNIHFKETHSD